MLTRYKQPKLTLDQASSHYLVVDAVNKAIIDYGCPNAIVKPFAQGGLGVIFTVQNYNNEAVLLKVPSYGRRDPSEHWLLEHNLAKEAIVLKELNCEAVPAIFKYDRLGKYIFREFAAGHRLADFYKKNQASDESKIKVIKSLFFAARQIFKAFHEHEKGCFVIRDFKPVNLIVGENDFAIQLVDVGGTRPENDMLSKTPRHYRIGSGKWLHWAPEQLMEKIEWLDRRVDYFSLGSTVFFIMTGRPAYKNIEPNRDKVIATYMHEYKHITQIIEKAGNSIRLPLQVIDFISKCLNPIYEERPYNIPEMIGCEFI